MKLVCAAYLIPISSPPIVNGAIAIEDGRIVDVGPVATLEARYPECEKEAYPAHVLLPGLINAHCHLDLTGFPRRPFDERSSYSRWLLEQSRYKHEVPKEFIRDAVVQGIEEVIASGTTCIGDMGSFSGMADLFRQYGLRGVIFSEIAHFNHESGQDLYQTALALIEELQERNDGLVRAGLGPYSAFTVSRQLLRIMAHYARQSQLPIQLHAAETFHEMEFFFDSKGDLAENLFPSVGWGDALPLPHLRTPIQYLSSIEFLNVHPTIVSPVHIGSSDMSILSQSASKLVHCPRHNQHCLEGLMPVGACLRAGISVGLGTESHASVPTLSMWDEMRACYELHQKSDTPLGFHDVLTMATLGGARALGLESTTGSLEVGKAADYTVVVVDQDMTADRLIQTLILKTTPREVTKVVVNDRVLKG